MRKWIFFLLLIAGLYALSKFKTKKQEKKYPILKQISETITLLVWVLLVAYSLAFLYWLYITVFK